jgi:hypothetical protein
VRRLIWRTYLNAEDRALVWAAHNKTREHKLFKSNEFQEGCAKHGYLNVIKWIYNTSGRFAFTLVASKAARSGHLEILKWMEQSSILGDVMGFLSCGAALGGHIETLKWLKKNNFLFGTVVCENAASRGDIVLLKWLKENECPWDRWSCFSAVQNGHLETLKWLMENGCPYDLDMLMSVAENNKNTHLLELLKMHI